MIGAQLDRAERLIVRALCILALLMAPFAAGADPYEPDDSAANARRVLISAIGEPRTFETSYDQDWILFYSTGYGPYTIEATTVSANCDMALALYLADGVTTLTPPGELDFRGAGLGEIYTALSLPKGFYYARFRNADPARFGPSSTFWLRVYQPTGAGLPIETVDERKIGIRPSPSPGQVGRAALAILTPGNGLGFYYLRHRIEFPGYEETTTGTAIDVTIRSAGEVEKFALPGQVFPSLSAALFVVETVQWSGATSAPVAFTDPVNITVEFAPPGSPAPGWNDIVTFANDAATSDRMWIVRDVMDGPSVDFRYLDGPQDVNAVQRTVTVRDYRGLTGSAGRASYGAVVRLTTDARRWELYR